MGWGLFVKSKSTTVVNNIVTDDSPMLDHVRKLDIEPYAGIGLKVKRIFMDVRVGKALSISRYVGLANSIYRGHIVIGYYLR